MAFFNDKSFGMKNVFSKNLNEYENNKTISA